MVLMLAVTFGTIAPAAIATNPAIKVLEEILAAGVLLLCISYRRHRRFEPTVQ
jgi:hypothetical protein